MFPLAIIGGSGLCRMDSLVIAGERLMSTPYGAPSAPLIEGSLQGKPVIFLARHGPDHSIPPHRINYRANIWALREAGIGAIVAVAAVGGISDEMAPEAIAVPQQIIDYSYGREQTYFDGLAHPLRHIDFTQPYSEALRQGLIAAARRAGLALNAYGVYGCTQGPRLETAAEIIRLRRDGCDMVGMTGMPEAALARELELDYACCAVVANRAAGIHNRPITMNEIETHLNNGMHKVVSLLHALVECD